MMRMQWKQAAGIALLGLYSLAACAQAAQQSTEPGNAPHGQWRREGGPERELDRLTRLLTLTPEQQSGVKSVLEQQSTQITALRTRTQSEAANETPETRQAQRTQVGQIRDETNTKITALLDDSQKKTFADWLQKRKAEMESRRGPGENPPPSPEQ